jgi:hypothetical protein
MSSGDAVPGEFEEARPWEGRRSRVEVDHETGPRRSGKTEGSDPMEDRIGA